MTEPLVCGVLLTADRPAMTARAIRSFEAQTYKNKLLLVLDSGRDKLNLKSTALIYATVDPGPNHGELCNLANSLAKGADIIAHFDSDDWSHPERLREQVGLLTQERMDPTLAEFTGRREWNPRQCDCVGYNDVLFWDSVNGEAWFYSHGGARYAVGASMCYWREAWERRPFEPMPTGSDTMWRHKVRVRGETSLQVQGPMMICELHGGNISSKVVERSEQWTRAPHWNDYCRERMEMNVNA